MSNAAWMRRAAWDSRRSVTRWPTTSELCPGNQRDREAARQHLIAPTHSLLSNWRIAVAVYPLGIVKKGVPKISFTAQHAALRARLRRRLSGAGSVHTIYTLGRSARIFSIRCALALDGLNHRFCQVRHPQTPRYGCPGRMRPPAAAELHAYLSSDLTFRRHNKDLLRVDRRKRSQAGWRNR